MRKKEDIKYHGLKLFGYYLYLIVGIFGMMGLLGTVFSFSGVDSNDEEFGMLVTMLIVTSIVSIHHILCENHIITWIEPLRESYDIESKISEDNLRSSIEKLIESQKRLEEREKRIKKKLRTI